MLPTPDPSPNPQCAASQNPSNPDLYQNDLNANFTFQKQDIITRQRFFAGFKLRLSVVFVAAQVDIGLAGNSRDTSRTTAVDRSGTQQTYSLSAGFDF
jgi:hypothetical protein